jgi:hypothetical protein
MRVREGKSVPSSKHGSIGQAKGALTGDTITETAEIEGFGRSKKSMKWLAQRYVE